MEVCPLIKEIVFVFSCVTVYLLPKYPIWFIGQHVKAVVLIYFPKKNITDKQTDVKYHSDLHLKLNYGHTTSTMC